MEQKIERAIDDGLESLSTGLYMLSTVFGIVLIVLGAFLVLKHRDSHKKSMANIGLISLVLGVIASISGIVQMQRL